MSSWVRSFRAGPPKLPSYSSLKLPSCSAETSAGQGYLAGGTRKNGLQHARLAERLAIRVFFADPLQSVATRHQREHEWAAAPVLAQGHRFVGFQAARVEPHRPSPHHALTKMSQVRHVPGSLSAPAPLFTRHLELETVLSKTMKTYAFSCQRYG